MRESAPHPYMHDSRLFELEKGRSVFRSALTIQTDPADIKRRFNKDNFPPLEDFYRERTLQIHVMHEYARLGAESADQASQLVNACFRLPRRRFLRKIDLLEGKSDAVSSDADDRRDTLMQGYKYIFVDEYQDIDEQLYSLVSALAGRRVPAQDAKLIVMAVGDDNQNVLPRA